MKYDAIVIGGGMIGSALTLGLAQLGRRVAIIESHLPQAYDLKQAPDTRLSALNLSSVRLLDRLGAWKSISAMRCQRYDELAVWEESNRKVDKTVFTAESINQASLGYFVENRLTQLGLHGQLESHSQVTWYTQSPIKCIDSQAGRITFTDGESIQGETVFGADGGHSQVRQQAKIGSTGWHYKHRALGIIIDCGCPSGNRTWQQFTPSGPMAFLPMYGQFAALIWYADPVNINQLAGLDDRQLKQRILEAFPPLEMDFTLVDRASFPLTRNHANQYVKGRTVLVGDAAHTINPLAGQGVNIGFKDVEVLLALFNEHQQPTYSTLVSEYEEQRRKHNLLMMSVMDAFYLGFSNDIAPLKWLRNAALTLAQHAGPLKERALKYALGI